VTASGRPRAIRLIVVSTTSLFVSVLVAWLSDIQSLVGVVLVFAALVGIPVLLLSLIDLGLILRAEHGGDYRATVTTRVLSHVQAGFGAVCMAAAGAVVYHHIRNYATDSAESQGAWVFLWVPMGILLALVGFSYIHSAFAPPTEETSGNDT